MTEQNIFQEIEADLERQKYEELWQRYGMWLVGAAVAIVLVTAGVSSWRSWHTNRNREATAALLNVMEKPGSATADQAQQMGDLEKFALTNHSMTHETLAQLDAAGLANSIGNTDRAMQLYDEMAKSPAIDPIYRQFADLMAVRTQMDTGDPAQLEKRLTPLMAEGAPWRFTAMEYDAFLALRAGDKEKARKVFSDLSQDARAPKSLGALATDMLHFLSE